MRTTINELVGRRGGAYSKKELESVLHDARRLLADTNALLQLEIERLFELDFDLDEKDRWKDLKALVTQVQKSQSQLLDIETKLGMRSASDAESDTKTVGLDLEAARYEILRRLARFTG